MSAPSSSATASGKPGDQVTVTGAKFTPLADNHRRRTGRSGRDRRQGRPSRPTPQGGFTGTLEVNDKATTGIVAYEGSAWSAEKGAGPAAYTVIDDTPSARQQPEAQHLRRGRHVVHVPGR